MSNNFKIPDKIFIKLIENHLIYNKYKRKAKNPSSGSKVITYRRSLDNYAGTDSLLSMPASLCTQPYSYVLYTNTYLQGKDKTIAVPQNTTSITVSENDHAN